MRLEVADGTAEGVGREKAPQAGGVIASEGVVEAGISGPVGGFGVALAAGEFVAGRAGGGLQAPRIGNLLTVRGEVGIVAKLARRLARATDGW